MELPSSFSGSIRFDLFHVDLPAFTPARLFFQTFSSSVSEGKRGCDCGGIEAFSDDLIRNHPRENSLLCVLSGVIFALCYFRVAHIYILVDFLLVGLDIAYIIAIGKFLPKGIANQVIHNRLSFLLVRPMIKFSDLLFDFYQ